MPPPFGSRRKPLAARRPALRLEALEDRDLPSLVGPTTYTVAPNQAAIAAADFTGDKFADLVTVGSGGAINVLVNKGDGTFNTTPIATTVPGVTAFTKVAAGDFNGDGKADVAALGVNANQQTELIVLFGKGDGTFDLTHIGVYSPGQGVTPDNVAAAPLAGHLTQEDIILHDGAGSLNNVSVLVNKDDGSGTFNPAVGYLQGGSSGGLAVGEFTGDNHLDVAVAQEGAVLVLAGDGAGGLAQQPIISNTQSIVPAFLATGPFVAGDHGDLAAGDASGRVVVLKNDGTGHFTPVGTATATGAPINSLVAGDFTDDGKFDVAVGGASGGVKVLRGDGAGNLAVDSTSTYGVGALSLAAADLNNDGVTDLAASDAGSVVAVSPANDVAVFLAQQIATDFAVSASTTTVTAGQPFTLTVTAEDANNNVVRGYAGRVGVTASDGDNAGLPSGYTFTTTDQGVHPFSVTLNTPGTNIVLTAGDLVAPTIKGSSQPITVQAAKPPVQVATQLVFSGVPASVQENTPFTFTVTVEDANNQTVAGYTGTIHFQASNGDNAGLPADYQFTAADGGSHQFIARLSQTGTVHLLANDAAQATLMGASSDILVTAPTPTPTPTPTPAPLPPPGPGVAVGRFFDGVQEPVVTSVTDNSVSIVGTQGHSYGCGSSAPTSPPATPVVNQPGSVSVVAAQPPSNQCGGGTPAGQEEVSQTVGRHPGAVATGTIVSPSGSEQYIATANTNDNSVSILTPLQNGCAPDGLNVDHTVKVGDAPRAVTTGNLRGHPTSDVAVANFGLGAGSGDPNGSVSILAGADNFSDDQTLTDHINQPDAVVAGNFLGDGPTADLAVANSGDGTISFFGHAASGGESLQFVSQFSLGANTQPTALAAADFDHDGNEDLAVTTAGDNSVRVLYGGGKGNFTVSGPVAVGKQPLSLTTADFVGKGGGPPDLAVGNYGDGTVTVLLNAGNRQFTTQTIPLFPGVQPTGIAAGDFNKDGYQDIVTSNADGSTSYLLNGGKGDGAFRSEGDSQTALFG